MKTYLLNSVFFDSTRNDLNESINDYPKYDIKHLDENVCLLKFMVAGFSSSELEVSLNENHLRVSGSASTSLISFRDVPKNFTRFFMLTDDITLYRVELVVDALLIFLEKKTSTVK